MEEDIGRRAASRKAPGTGGSKGPRYFCCDLEDFLGTWCRRSSSAVEATQEREQTESRSCYLYHLPSWSVYPSRDWPRIRGGVHQYFRGSEARDYMDTDDKVRRKVFRLLNDI